MNDNTPQASCSKSCCGLGTILLVIVSLAVGFAGGHIVADMNLIKGAPTIPEAKQGGTPSNSSSRGVREGERSTEDAAEKTEDAVNEAAQNLDDAADG
jgi:hypothetical protein